MAEGSSLLNCRRGKLLPRVQIPPSPPVSPSVIYSFPNFYLHHKLVSFVRGGFVDPRCTCPVERDVHGLQKILGFEQPARSS